jgi:hypothetical protein
MSTIETSNRPFYRSPRSTFGQAPVETPVITTAPNATKPQPKPLPPAAIDQYHRDGYCFPIRIMSEAEAGALRQRLETYEASTGGPLDQAYRRHKCHLLFTWLWELTRRSRPSRWPPCRQSACDSPP